MRLVLSALMICSASFAAADGFALQDFTRADVDLTHYKGGMYDANVQTGRIIIACSTCDDLTLVSVEKGRSTDGTEGRFRSGETTVEKMQSICQQRDPDCTLERLDVGGAVGWVTQYALGPTQGSTAVLFRDGDMLTIRVVSDSRNRTGANMGAALQHLAPQIVGE